MTSPRRPGSPAAGGRLRARARAVAAHLAGTVGLRLAAAKATLAADPTASAGGGGDVRTSPAAPGLAGDPLFAVLGVVLVALVAAGATLLAARLADRR